MRVLLGARDSRSGGFTLIELLVVVLVIAILAGIAIPVFIRQREKGWSAQVQSTLKNASLVAESVGTETDGYSALDENVALLEANGFNTTDSISVAIRATDASFCIAAAHDLLPSGVGWWVGSYDSLEGRPEAGVPSTPMCLAAAQEVLEDALAPPAPVDSPTPTDDSPTPTPEVTPTPDPIPDETLPPEPTPTPVEPTAPAPDPTPTKNPGPDPKPTKDPGPDPKPTKTPDPKPTKK